MFVSHIIEAFGGKSNSCWTPDDPFIQKKRPILTPFQRENRKIQGVGQKRKVQQTLEFTGLFWRRVRDSNPRDLSVYSISSLVRTWRFRVCCGRWRQFWKRRKPLCYNGFRTRRPVLTSSISEKTRVQIEMRNAPKRSIFLCAGKKTCKKKTLVRYGFADSPPD